MATKQLQQHEAKQARMHTYTAHTLVDAPVQQEELTRERDALTKRRAQSDQRRAAAGEAVKAAQAHIVTMEQELAAYKHEQHTQELVRVECPATHGLQVWVKNMVEMRRHCSAWRGSGSGLVLK